MVKVAAGPKIVVDKEFAALIPKIGADELELLEANIVAEGCIDPLVVWDLGVDHVLLDGHNRLKLCRQHDKAFRIHRIKLKDRNAARDWVINHQLGKRNVSDEQRRYLLGKLWREAPKSDGGRPGSETTDKLSEVLTPENTAKAVAENHDVTEREVYRAAEYSEAVDAIGEKSPELKDAILAGDVKPTAADLEALAEAPKRTVARAAKRVAKAKKAGDKKAAKEAVKEAAATVKSDDDAGGYEPTEADPHLKKLDKALRSASMAWGEVKTVLGTSQALSAIFSGIDQANKALASFMQARKRKGGK